MFSNLRKALPPGAMSECPTPSHAMPRRVIANNAPLSCLIMSCGFTPPGITSPRTALCRCRLCHLVLMTQLYDLDPGPSPPPGLLSIARPLSDRPERHYQLNVTATDHGQPPQRASTGVRVDVQHVSRHISLFSRPLYTANVSERAAVGTLVARVAADRTGAEDGGPTFVIPAGVAGDAFRVDPRTGVVTTARRLDRETTDRHVVTVYASEGAVPTRFDAATIVVDVLDENDHSPEFR